MKFKTILLVDDETAITSAITRVLRGKHTTIMTANSGQQALDTLAENNVDIIISDLSMPGMTGNELFSRVAQEYPETIRIMLTAHTDINLVLEAVNNGRVWGYLQKPWNNDELRILVEQASQMQDVLAERSMLKQTLQRYQKKQRPTFEGFIGDSIAMQFVYNAIERAAPSNASMFLTGASGTGKEVAAEAIHKLSKRKNAAFVALNCAAIPSELMESEIFGHVKGAFSGALSNRDGAATMADGGTLFLDELGEMDMALQAKLLRFIQTGEYQKVGSDKTERANIRFIAATNRDPLQAIADQVLREDLYYRLNVISIDLPPLKERDQDPLQIAQYFLTRFSEEEEKIFAGFSADAEMLLTQYDWPGNVRQLRNLIHSAVIMSDGPIIGSEELGRQLKLDKTSINNLSVASPVGTSASMPVAEFAPDNPLLGAASEAVFNIEPLATTERRAIERAIQHFDDNVVQAANALQVSPSTLYRKMQSWQEEN
ncbi:sigma-54-dependent transcriptional regulator [Planctobacterium marinum]|uniref:Sigma-54-dependent Fis family transcriptional regulator n=1 Tax=Planctobacterium marinum TaxID=1631968 RepID=A0AA48HYP3_9ALTE|nr:sigma-54-dependent Fis family transcriptional regulator [Planctobacterium marinum]